MKNKKNKNAFTLIESSIVLILIGLVISVVLGGAKIIAISKLASARSLTASSPAMQTSGLVLWLESTLKSSFIESEANAGIIGTWNDQNPQSHTKYNATSAGTNRPAYNSNGINGLPSLTFDGVNDNLTGSTFISGDSLTIFVVAKRTAMVNNASAVVVYNPSLSTGDNNSLSSFTSTYEGAGGVIQSYRNSTNLSSANHPGNNIPYVFVTKFDGTNNTVYLNGAAQTLVASSGNFTTNTYALGARYTSSALNIFYNGNIGEVIIFNRALSDVERQDIENYLSRKWRIKFY